MHASCCTFLWQYKSNYGNNYYSTLQIIGGVHILYIMLNSCNLDIQEECLYDVLSSVVSWIEWLYKKQPTIKCIQIERASICPIEEVDIFYSSTLATKQDIYNWIWRFTVRWSNWYCVIRVWLTWISRTHSPGSHVPVSVTALSLSIYFRKVVSYFWIAEINLGTRGICFFI